MFITPFGELILIPNFSLLLTLRDQFDKILGNKLHEHDNYGNIWILQLVIWKILQKMGFISIEKPLHHILNQINHQLSKQLTHYLVVQSLSQIQANEWISIQNQIDNIIGNDLDVLSLLHALGTIFEQLQQIEQKKSHGVYYTPNTLTQFMCNELISHILQKIEGLNISNQSMPILSILKKISANDIKKIESNLDKVTILDPALGAGHFFVSLIELLEPIYEFIWRKSPHSISHNFAQHLVGHIFPAMLFGVDRDPLAIWIAQVRFILLWIYYYLKTESVLTIQKDSQKVPDFEKIFQIRVGNSLCGLIQNPLGLQNTNSQSEYDQQFCKINNLKPDQIMNLDFFHWVREFPQIFDHGGFDIVIGNPPYGGEIHDIELKIFATYNLSKGNIAKLFLVRSWELTKMGGSICLILPKALTYTSDWTSVRTYFHDPLHKLIDVKEAFEDVLLEQIIAIFRKGSTDTLYYAKDFHQLHTYLPISKFLLPQTWLCDITAAEIKILEKLMLLPKLTNYIHTKRGLALQRYKISVTKGESPKFRTITVLGGKNLTLYGIKGAHEIINITQIPNKFKSLYIPYLQPKLLFQNIVAYISLPVPHIRVMGTYDSNGYMVLDTVNVVELTTSACSWELILGIMNSLLFSWLLHRLGYNKAVRTMHLDNYALSKVPIPHIETTTKLNVQIIALVQDLLHQSTITTSFLDLESLILQLYGLTREKMPSDYQQLWTLWEQKTNNK